MQMSTIFHPTLPPMYAWPRALKRTVLALSVVAVVTAYLLLAGGVVAAVAVLAQGM
jgi:hypothetical protein